MRKKLVYAVTALLLLALTACAVVLGSNAAKAADIANGTSGTCDWVISSDGVLTISPTDGVSGTLDNWSAGEDASHKISGTVAAPPWYSNRASIKKIVFTGAVTATTCCRMFCGTALTSAPDFTNLDTSSVTDFYAMFYSVTTLTQYDLTALDMSSACYLGYMFYGNTGLTTLTLPSAPNATNMAYAFRGCSALTAVNMSGVGSGASLTTMAYAFENDKALRRIVVDDSWTPSSTMKRTSMFSNTFMLVGNEGTTYSTPGLTNDGAIIDTATTPGFLTASSSTRKYSVSDALWAFDNITKIEFTDNTVSPSGTQYPLSQFENSVAWTDGLGTMFISPSLVGKSIVKENGGNSMFAYMPKVKYIDFNGNIDTSQVKGMALMFYNNATLLELDLSDFDTSSALKMNSMFSTNPRLRKLVISNFNTAKCASFTNMFSNTYVLENIDCSSFDTSGVMDPSLVESCLMSNMFNGAGIFTAKGCTITLGTTFKIPVPTETTKAQTKMFQGATFSMYQQVDADGNAISSYPLTFDTVHPQQAQGKSGWPYYETGISSPSPIIEAQNSFCDTAPAGSTRSYAPCYQMSWDANGGTFTDGTIHTEWVRCGTEIPITPSITPTRSGYHIQGYTELKDDNTTLLTDVSKIWRQDAENGSYGALSAFPQLTFYASWAYDEALVYDTDGTSNLVDVKANGTSKSSVSLSFELTPQDGAPAAINATATDVKNTGTTKTNLGEISFDSPGTYNYVVRCNSTNSSGWVVSHSEFPVSITVSQDTSGALVITNVTKATICAYNCDGIATDSISSAYKDDANQGNFQEDNASGTNGDTLLKAIHWVNKESGTAEINIAYETSQPLTTETRALYLFTSCDAHGFTAEKAVENITTLLQWYDVVDAVVAYHPNTATTTNTTMLDASYGVHRFTGTFTKGTTQETIISTLKLGGTGTECTIWHGGHIGATSFLKIINSYLNNISPTAIYLSYDGSKGFATDSASSSISAYDYQAGNASGNQYVVQGSGLSPEVLDNEDYPMPTVISEENLAKIAQLDQDGCYYNMTSVTQRTLAYPGTSTYPYKICKNETYLMMLAVNPAWAYTHADECKAEIEATTNKKTNRTYAYTQHMREITGQTYKTYDYTQSFSDLEITYVVGKSGTLTDTIDARFDVDKDNIKVAYADGTEITTATVTATSNADGSTKIEVATTGISCEEPITLKIPVTKKSTPKYYNDGQDGFSDTNVGNASSLLVYDMKNSKTGETTKSEPLASASVASPQLYTNTDPTAITVEKTVSSATASVGDTISYTVTAKATGEEGTFAYDLSITDEMASSLIAAGASIKTDSVTVAIDGTDLTSQTTVSVSGAKITATLPSSARLQSNGNHSLTMAYQVQLGDVSNTAMRGKTYNNTVTVSSSNVASASDDASVKITDPSMKIEKQQIAFDGSTASQDGVHKTGDKVKWYFRITNTGDTDLTDIAVTDDLISDASSLLPNTSLPAGESMTFSAEYTLEQTDIDATKVTNTASTSAKSGNIAVSSGPVSAEIRLVSDAKMELLKTVDVAEAFADDTLTYTITVTNTGNVTLKTMTVKDPLLGIDKTYEDAAPGFTDTITGTYKVKDSDASVGKVTNTATLSATTAADITAPSAIEKSVETTVNAPGITLEKQQTAFDGSTVSQDGTHFADDKVKWYFRVTNTGNATLTDINIDDPLLGDISSLLPENVLPADESMTFSAEYSLTQDDVNTGKVANTATASAKCSGTDVTSSPATAEIKIYGVPEMELTKSVDKSTANIGDSLTYTITVTNSGNVPLTTMTVKDPLLSIDKTYIDVAPGFTDTITGTYKVKESDAVAGSVKNTATLSATTATGITPPATITKDATTTVSSHPNIYLVKSVSKTTIANPKAGDTIVYTFELENKGDITIKNIALIDAMLSNQGYSLLFDSVILAPTDKTSARAVYTITQTDIDRGSITNTALARGINTADNRNTDSNESTVTTVLTRSTSLRIEKTAQEKTVNIGEEALYDITVTNTGNTTLKEVRLTDEKAGINDETIATNLAPGGKCSLENIALTATEADAITGSIENSATATGTPQDGLTAPTATDTASTAVTSASSLLLTKTVSPSVVEDAKAGDTVRWSFSVKNTGDLTVRNITIDDPLLKEKNITLNKTTLAPGETTSATVEYSLTQSEVDAGKTSNTATATGTDATGKAVTSNQAEAKATITGTTSLSITKTVDKQTARLGDTLTYTITVTNTSSYTLKNVYLIDEGLGIDGTIASSLASGDNVIIIRTHIVTQEDIENGTINSTATASAESPSEIVTPPVSKSADAPTTVLEEPSLIITKAANQTEFTNPSVGDTFTWTIAVTNTGNVSVSGVEIEDELAVSRDLTVDDIGTLTAGETKTIEIEDRITQTDIDAGKIENTAKASGTTPTGKTVSTDKATATVEITHSDNLAIEKKVDRAIIENAKAGDVLTYEIEVSNAGTTTLNDVSMTDLLTDAKVIKSTWDDKENILAPGEKTVFTVSYGITEADITAGTVKNTAKATATGSDGTIEKETSVETKLIAPIVNTPTETPAANPASDLVSIVSTGDNIVRILALSALLIIAGTAAATRRRKN